MNLDLERTKATQRNNQQMKLDNSKNNANHQKTDLNKATLKFNKQMSNAFYLQEMKRQTSKGANHHVNSATH